MPAHYLVACIFVIALLHPAPTRSEAARQNSFNAENYQPRGALNSMPPPTPIAARAQPKTSSAKSKAPLKVEWSWNSHRFSNSSASTSQRGVFYYQQQNNRIDTSSLCNNYRPGSLIYRDCRKAAKAYFKRQCSNQFMAACAAAGMTP